MPELFSFEENNHFFIKFFVLDGTLNLNQWGVTENSVLANLDTFIGKPFVITDGFDHPEAPHGDELLRRQEAFRVGDITTMGFDKAQRKAYGIAEITDSTAKEQIKSGEVKFVSPSIIFNRMTDARILVDGSLIIDKWEGAHVAGVKDPAFGMYKAQIKGQCSGDKATCETELAMVQASKKTKILQFELANKTIMVKASECVENCIQSKADSGKELNDKAIAICFSECGESQAILKKEKKPYPAEKANIDPQSLENITVIDIPTNKKKKEAVNEPGKPNKKCNIDKSLPCVNLEEGSLKGKAKKAKAMTAQEDEKKDEEAQEDEEKKDAINEETDDINVPKDSNIEEDKIDAQDEDEEKKDAEEDDKDETKESKKALRNKIAALEAKFARQEKAPLVNKIVDAKIDMGYISEASRTKTSNDLYRLSANTLNTMVSDYTKMANASKAPKLPYEAVYASRTSGKTPDFDTLLERLKR